MIVSHQNLTFKITDDLAIARKYYTILFLFNEIHITERELDMVAFSSVYGTLSTPPVRQQFMDKYKVSKAFMHNLSSSLQKKGLLVKDVDKKIRINPKIAIDVKKPGAFRFNILVIK